MSWYRWKFWRVAYAGCFNGSYNYTRSHQWEYWGYGFYIRGRRLLTLAAYERAQTAKERTK